MLIRGAAGIALAFSASIASGHDLVVEVSGVKSDRGEVGCALYAGPDGFPLDPTKAQQRWQPAKRGGVTCRFSQLPPGDYAVAVSHDLNGNHRTDSNFLGMPREDWGVSNNVRPSLRAPQFTEARVPVRGEAVRIDVRLGR